LRRANVSLGNTVFLSAFGVASNGSALVVSCKQTKLAA